MATWIDKAWDAGNEAASIIGPAVDPFRSDSKKEALINFTGANHAIPVAYGECELPAKWVGFRRITDRQWCGLAVFCYAPIEKILEVNVNGKVQPIYYHAYPYHGREDIDDHGVWYSFRHTGAADDSFAKMFGHYPDTEGNEFPPLNMELPQGENEPLFFTGLVGAEFKFDVKKGLVTDIPQVTIKVLGRNMIFDPRVDTAPGDFTIDDPEYKLYRFATPFATGGTIPACTNPALVEADYLTNPYYGKGIPWDQIDMDQLINAANICDTQVPDGDGQNIKLMEFAGILNPEDKIDTNLELIDKHFRCHRPRHNGKFGFVIRDDYPTPETVPEKWIKSYGAINFGDKSKRYNYCIVSYPEPLYDLEDFSVIWPALDSQNYADYLAEDGEPLKKEIKLEGCRNRYQAIDYAEAVVRESRLQKTTTLELLWPAIKWQAGDVVDVNLKGIGLTRMRITRVTTQPSTHTVKWELREHSNDAYPWSTKQSIPLPAKDTQATVSIDAPDSLAFTPEAANDTTAGSLTWDDIPHPFIKGFSVAIKNADNGRFVFNTITTETNCDVPNLPSGNYSVSVRAVTERTNGPEALLSIQIISPVIEPITGLALISPFTGPDCQFKWSEPSNAVFTVHEYVVQILNADTDALIYEERVKDTQFNFDYLKNKESGLNRRFKINVYAAGKLGQTNVDTGAATITVENPAASLPTGIVTSSEQNKVTVKFNQIADPDFAVIKAWLKTTSGFTPVEGEQSITTSGNQITFNDLQGSTNYYLVIGALDAFNDEADTGSLSGEIAITTAPNAEEEIVNGIAKIEALADMSLVQQILDADETIKNRREIVKDNNRITVIEVLTEDQAARLESVESDQSSANLLLQTLQNNGSTQANAALYVDQDGALAGIFTSINSTTSEMVFKSDNFRFKTSTGNLQPFTIHEDRINFDGDINIDNGKIIFTSSTTLGDDPFHDFKAKIDVSTDVDVRGLFVKANNSTAILARSLSGAAITASADTGTALIATGGHTGAYLAGDTALIIQNCPTAARIGQTSWDTMPTNAELGASSEGQRWSVVTDRDGIWVRHDRDGFWTNLLNGTTRNNGISTNRVFVTPDPN